MSPTEWKWGKNGEVYLIFKNPQYPTIRLKNCKYPVNIWFTPEDPRLAGSSEKLVIELKENASGPIALALLLRV